MKDQTFMINAFEAELLNARRYNKGAIVDARPGIMGEEVVTQLATDDKPETINTVKVEGSMVVTNPGGELYILLPNQMEKNYDSIGNGKYQAKGQIQGIEYSGENIEFQASWGELMILKHGDTVAGKTKLVDVVGSEEQEIRIVEVYRIGRNEMALTYLPMVPTVDGWKTANEMYNKETFSVADAKEAEYNS